MKTFKTKNQFQKNSTFFISVEVVKKDNDYYVDIGFNKQSTIVNSKNKSIIKKLIKVVIANQNQKQIFEYIENEITRLSNRVTQSDNTSD